LTTGPTAKSAQDRLIVPFLGNLETSTADLSRALSAVPEGRIVEVSLPREAALVRRHKIPFAARRQIQNVLTLDLQRTTPLDLSEVRFRHAIVGRAEDALLVDQYVVKRADLALLEARINRAGYALGDVRVEDQDNNLTLSFTDKNSAYKSTLGIWPRVNVILAGLILVLTAVEIWLPHVGRQRSLHELRLETAALRAETVTARDTLSKKLAAQDIEETLIVYLNERPTASELLRELTLQIPDNAWITDLEITGTMVRFNGLIDGSAADLSISLANSQTFKNPRLMGPVSIARGSDLQSFVIAVDLSRAAK
ncbi:MAG: PilN domain-containing protein, partial [Pseudomonadota bacterium]